jgi:hypothetical protein
VTRGGRCLLHCARATNTPHIAGRGIAWLAAAAVQVLARALPCSSCRAAELPTPCWRTPARPQR